jgi:hypothetical protein
VRKSTIEETGECGGRTGTTVSLRKTPAAILITPYFIRSILHGSEGTLQYSKSPPSSEQEANEPDIFPAYLQQAQSNAIKTL